MSEVLDAPAHAIRDVLAVHDVFRTALAAAPQLVGGVQTPDSDRAAVVAMYYAHILALLHVHHDLEEEYLWGRLRARLSPDPTSSDSTRLLVDHQDAVGAALEAADDCLDSWTEEPSIYRGVPLAVALSALLVPLSDQLQHEEEHLLPLAEDLVSPAEWAELRTAALAAIPDAQPWLVFGLVQDEMTPEQRKRLLAAVPTSARQSWQDSGQERFARFISRLWPM